MTILALTNPFVEATKTLNRQGVAISEKRVRTISESVSKAALNDRDQQLEQFSNGTLPKGNSYICAIWQPSILLVVEPL